MELLQDRVFNLQLTIQRLEEELTLFRNGTTAEDMLNIIKEKDSEIDDLRARMAEKDCTLRKLAKGSSDVLSKYDEAVSRNKDLLVDTHELTASLKDRDAEIAAKNEEISRAHMEITNLKESLDFMQEQRAAAVVEMDSLRLYVEDLNGELKLKDEEMSENIAELSRVIELGERQQQQLEEEKQRSIALEGRLGECVHDIDSLQTRCARLVGDKNSKSKELDAERRQMINQVQEFRRAMEGTIAQRDASLLKKEERIKELKLSVVLLQQELKLKTQSVDRLQADRASATRPSNNQDQVQDTAYIKHEDITSRAQGLDLGPNESTTRDRREPDLVSRKLRSLSMTGASTPSSQQAKRPVLGDSNAVQGASSVDDDVLNI